MDIIINKNNDEAQANQELKKLIGSISIDFTWKNLKSDIFSASRDLKKILGPEVYEYLVKEYQTNEEVPEGELLYTAQYALCLKALLSYLPKNDIAVTDNGRVMYRDDQTVAAFEYQINNQNEAFERDYYKTLDTIFSILDEENTILKTSPTVKWKETDTYKATQSLFIENTDQFDEHFIIQSRFLFQKLTPAIKQCMKFELEPRIPTEMFEATLSKSEDYNEQLYYYCQMACVYYAMSWGIKHLRATLFPEGVLQSHKSQSKTIKSKSSPVKLEAELVVQEFNKDTFKAFQKIERIVQENRTTNADAELDPVKLTSNGKYISL